MVSAKGIRFVKFWNRRAALLAATALVLPVVLAGCGGSDSSDTSASASGKTTIKYATENYVLNMPLLADALGYLPNLDLKPVTNGLTIPPAQFIQSVLKDDVTYGFSNFGALITANAQGQKVKAAIAFNGNADGADGGFYVKDDSPIKTAADLKGKKIATVAGTLSEFILDRYLDRNGLKVDDVTHVSVSYAGGEGEQQVRQGSVDAFYASGNTQTQAVARGGLRKLVSDKDVLGDITLDAYFFGNEWVAKHPKAYAEFIEGTAKAIDWSQTNKPDVVLAKYVEYLKANGQSDLVSGHDGWTTNGDLKGGVITKASFEENEKWLIQIGQLKDGQVEASDVITNAHNPFAAQVPGS